MGEDNGKFWRGPITTHQQAEKIVNYTAGGYGILGALGILTAFSPTSHNNVFIGLLFGALSLGLMRAKSLLAARLLLGVSAFSVVAPFAMFVYGLTSGHQEYAWIGLFLAVIWFFPALATARACTAAKFIRDHRLLAQAI